MKLNKPKITTLIIVILVINLIFFSFTLISKALVNKDNITSIIDNYDFKEYILNNEVIKESINNYKYPKEVFNYIDDFNLKKLKKSMIDNLHNNKDIILNKDDLSYLIKNSIYEYDVRTKENAYDLVISDIEYLVIDADNYFNDEIINQFNIFRFFSNDMFNMLSICISIILTFMLIIIEKRNGYLLGSIIMLSYTAIIFYLDKNILSIIPNLGKYISNKQIIAIDNQYMICFILGFVLLLIYIISYLKKEMRDYRLSKWR